MGFSWRSEQDEHEQIPCCYILVIKIWFTGYGKMSIDPKLAILHFVQIEYFPLRFNACLFTNLRTIINGGNLVISTWQYYNCMMILCAANSVGIMMLLPEAFWYLKKIDVSWSCTLYIFFQVSDFYQTGTPSLVEYLGVWSCFQLNIWNFVE